jgi:hypothetical protein
LYERPNVFEQPLPVLLFLHGAGESGRDGIAPATVGIANHDVAQHAPVACVARGQNVAPVFRRVNSAARSRGLPPMTPHTPV